MTLHRFGDLVLESEFPLPTLPSLDHGVATYVIREEPDVASSERSKTRWDHHWCDPLGNTSLSCAREKWGYRLRFPGLATFGVDSGGGEITWRAESAIPTETIEHLLIDQVLPRVLAWHGRVVLHAACVASTAGAIAFLGASGSGKSTLAAALARAGWALLGDDTILVRRDTKGGFEAVPTYTGLRLLPSALEQLAGGLATRSVAHTTAKRRVAVESSDIALASGPVFLREVHVLSGCATAGEVRLEPIRGLEAILALVRGSFQLHLDDSDRASEFFARIVTLADMVPLRRLSYPRRFHVLPHVIREIEKFSGLFRSTSRTNN